MSQVERVKEQTQEELERVFVEKRQWQEHKLAGTDYVLKYRIEPGCFVANFLGVDLRFENFAKMENFFREYLEAIHFHTDYNPPPIDMGLDCE